MGKKCQVCGGPVVNGRCKYCGMPYRNDMELYHLNEDRSEHYRHSSAKVRKSNGRERDSSAGQKQNNKKAGKKSGNENNTENNTETEEKRSQGIKKFLETYIGSDCSSRTVCGTVGYN